MMTEKDRQMMGDFQKLMASEEGKQLLSLLSSNGGSALKSAAETLKAGDEAGAKAKMEPLVNNPEIQKLLNSLEKTMNHG